MMKKIVNNGVLEEDWYCLGGETETVADASLLTEKSRYYLAYANEEDFLTTAMANGVLHISGDQEVEAEINGWAEEELYGTVIMSGNQNYAGDFSAKQVEVTEGSSVSVTGEIFDFENLVVNGELTIDFEQLYSLTDGGTITGQGVLQIATEEQWVVNQNSDTDFSGFTGRVEMKDATGTLILGQGEDSSENPEKSYFADGATVSTKGGQHVKLTGESVTTGIVFSGEGTLTILGDQILTANQSIGTAEVKEGATVSLRGDFTGDIDLNKDSGDEVTELILGGTGSTFGGKVTGDSNDRVVLERGRTFTADDALTDFEGTISLNGQTLILSGTNVVTAEIEGEGVIYAKDDLSIQGDLSDFTGSYQADKGTTVTLTGTVGEQLFLDGGHYVLKDVVAEQPLQIEGGTTALNLDLGTQTVELTGGSFGTVTGTGTLDLREYQGEEIDLVTLDFDGGTVLISSEHPVTVEGSFSGHLVVEIDGGATSSTLICGDSDTLEDLESLTIYLDENANLPEGYSPISMMGGVLPANLSIHLVVGEEERDLKIEEATRINGALYTISRQDGGIKLVTSDTYDKIYVSEQWDGEEFSEVTDTLYATAQSCQRRLGYDAAGSLNAALTSIRPNADGAGVIELAENGEYQLSSGYELNGGMEKLTLQSRADWGNATIAGEIQAGEVEAISLVNLTVTGSVYGAGKVIIQNSRANRVSGSVISAGGELEIEGGIYTAQAIAGGSVNQVIDGETKVTLRGKTDKASIASDIYGGGIVTETGVSLEQTEKSSIFVDVREEQKLHLAGGIYGGGYAKTGGNLMISGDRQVTFTGKGSNLTFTGRVSGGGKGVTITAGKASLVFDNYQGKFSGAIADFDELSLRGNTSLTLARRQINCQNMVLSFTVTAETLSENTAMYTLRDTDRWEFSQTIQVNLDGASYGDYLLVDNYAGDFDGFSFTVCGQEVQVGEETTLGNTGKKYLLSLENQQLRLNYQALNLMTMNESPQEEGVPTVYVNFSWTGTTGTEVTDQVDADTEEIRVIGEDAASSYYNAFYMLEPDEDGAGAIEFTAGGYHGCFGGNVMYQGDEIKGIDWTGTMPERENQLTNLTLQSRDVANMATLEGTLLRGMVNDLTLRNLRVTGEVFGSSSVTIVVENPDVTSDYTVMGMTFGGGTLTIEGGCYGNYCVGGGYNQTGTENTEIAISAQRYSSDFSSSIIGGALVSTKGTVYHQTGEASIYLDLSGEKTITISENILVAGYAFYEGKMNCSGNRLLTLTGKAANLSLKGAISGGATYSNCTITGGTATLKLKDFTGTLENKIWDFDQICVEGNSQVSLSGLSGDTSQLKFAFVLTDDSSSQNDKTMYIMQDSEAWNFDTTITVQIEDTIHSGCYGLIGNGVSVDFSKLTYCFGGTEYGMSQQGKTSDSLCWMTVDENTLRFNYLKNQTLEAGESLQGNVALGIENDSLKLDIDSFVQGTLDFGTGDDQLTLTGFTGKIQGTDDNREISGAKLLATGVNSLEHLFVDQTEVTWDQNVQIAGGETADLSDDLWCHLSLKDEGLLAVWGQNEAQLSVAENVFDANKADLSVGDSLVLTSGTYDALAAGGENLTTEDYQLKSAWIA